MAQAVVDPAEIRRFAHNLKVFTGDVRGDLSSLHTQLLCLGDTCATRNTSASPRSSSKRSPSSKSSWKSPSSTSRSCSARRAADRVPHPVLNHEPRRGRPGDRCAPGLAQCRVPVPGRALEALGSISLEVRRAFDLDRRRRAKPGTTKPAGRRGRGPGQGRTDPAKTPNFDGRIPDTSVQEAALARAKARHRFAEDQVEVCRKWAVRLPKMVNEDYEGTGPPAGQFPRWPNCPRPSPTSGADREPCTFTPR